MSWSPEVVIDLTEESPPGPSRPRPSTLGAATHILDWSSSSRADRSSSHGIARGAASSSSGPSSSRFAADGPIVVGSDDEDDDNSFTITGQSEPVRRSHPLHRSVSLASASPFHRSSATPSASASSVRFHDGIGRGPHGAGSHVRPAVDVPGSFPLDRHPLFSQRRAAIPTAGANAAARRSGESTANGDSTANRSDSSLMSRLGGDFLFGRYGFGTTYSMELLGSLIRGWHSNGGAADPPQSAEQKVPQKYDVKWTHPCDEQPAFTHSIVEPPVDLDTFFDDKAVVTGPLPETTPICPCCRHALVTGANGDERIWVLPCGHAIDGRCLDKLSGLTPPPAVESRSPSKGKGKAKAKEAPEDEPPAKVARTGARTRATATVAETKATTPTKPKKPKRFLCPVEGCCQKCSKESGGKYSAWEVFA
ncbi:conserved hypothetical protein [Sporisorium reilianum SRZ2]|uniref:Uncharacterized protein n=1 Tax=Sporisorium reilianum (strain SRZ2) TaxID=999809 RepID=E6ZKX1_SPORE|nr:conserved hypothetical protein [Sporisorium reilianum SRZ2]